MLGFLIIEASARTDALEKCELCESSDPTGDETGTDAATVSGPPAADPEGAAATPDKKKAGYCEHGRRRSRCKECGGSGLCEHGRERRRCKECGGSGLCKHGRERSRCKECGGSAICEHGRRRYQCKECTRCVVEAVLAGEEELGEDVLYVECAIVDKRKRADGDW